MPHETPQFNPGSVEQFKIGDCVRLKSGGPEMTVEAVENDRIRCVWFDSLDELNRRSFSAALLKLTSARGDIPTLPDPHDTEAVPPKCAECSREMARKQIGSTMGGVPMLEWRCPSCQAVPCCPGCGRRVGMLFPDGGYHLGDEIIQSDDYYCHACVSFVKPRMAVPR